MTLKYDSQIIDINEKPKVLWKTDWCVILFFAGVTLKIFTAYEEESGKYFASKAWLEKAYRDIKRFKENININKKYLLMEIR